MMKRILTLLSVLLLAAGFAAAQEEGIALAKSANKALTAFNMDRTGNAAKLDEARKKIEAALQTPEAEANPTAWLSKGDICDTILQIDAIVKINKGPALTLEAASAIALGAFQAYARAFDLAEKKYEKTDALKGLRALQDIIINKATEVYQQSAYDLSYQLFSASFQIHDRLKANGINVMESALDDPTQYKGIMNFAAMTAKMAKRYQDALPLYEKIVKAGTDKPEVYAALYEIKTQLGDAAGAAVILAEGRKKFPDDKALLELRGKGN